MLLAAMRVGRSRLLVGRVVTHAEVMRVFGVLPILSAIVTPDRFDSRSAMGWFVSRGILASRIGRTAMRPPLSTPAVLATARLIAETGPSGTKSLQNQVILRIVPTC
jgi:hypothetical protein